MSLQVSSQHEYIMLFSKAKAVSLSKAVQMCKGLKAPESSAKFCVHLRRSIEAQTNFL